MREKVSTAYFLDDPRKFSSMEEAEKELNRLRAVCVRLKKKQGEDIAFMLGLSVTDSQYMGKMGYQKSMRYGGKKVFICSERRIHNGERVGKLLQDYYPRAAQNAKSAAELQFEKDKAAELDRLESALIPFLQANIIGGGMLKAAEERVTADVVKQGDELYFSDEADEDEKGKEKGYVYRPL